MIEGLTKKQEQKIKKYRALYFNRAVSTITDKPRAEKAAKRLAEIGGLENLEITWVTNPEEKIKLCPDEEGSLSASLSNSLSDSLWASPSDSLIGSLSDSLWASHSDSLWASLRNSFWDSLWDRGWLSYCSYSVEVLGVECGYRDREILYLYNELAASCFAIWVSKGQIVLCEKPQKVEILDGKVKSIEWKQEQILHSIPLKEKNEIPMIPTQIIYAIQHHVLHGQHGGSFVTAVLENNLREAISYADEECLAALAEIVRYCYNNIPMRCWGSELTVKNWQKIGGDPTYKFKNQQHPAG